MPRFIWSPLTPSLALKSTQTTAEKQRLTMSSSTTKHLRAAVTAWAAARLSIFHPSSVSRLQSFQRKSVTTQAPPPCPAGRFRPIPILLDPAR
jgi:hypothetical protein